MAEKQRIRVQAGSDRITNDSFANFRANIGYGTNNISTGGTYGFNPISRNRTLLEWMYRGAWLVRQAVDAPADDMIRAGTTIDSDMPPDAIDSLQSYWRSLKIWQRLNECAKWARLYGGCLAVIMIDGQNLESELRLDTISEGQFKGLVIMDRWMVMPDLSNLVSSPGSDFNMPKYYQTVTTFGPFPDARIHYTRVIRLDGADLPYWQRVAENGWGLSIIEPMFDRMIAYDSATSGAAQLVYRAHLRILKVNQLRQLIAAGGPAYQGFLSYVQTMRATQSNEGLTILDAEDDFQQQTYTFAGLSDMLVQFGQQISGATQIPLTRLFGQAPAGLNATGESDMRNYYDAIAAKQESDLREGINKLYAITHRSLFGQPLPKGFGFSFSPLYRLNDNEKIGNAATVTNAVDAAVAGGLVGRKTALKELRQSSRITGVWSNITDEEIENAESEPPPPQMMLPGEEGMPGEEGAALPTEEVMEPDPAATPTEKGEESAMVASIAEEEDAEQMEPQNSNGGGPRRPDAPQVIADFVKRARIEARTRKLLGRDSSKLPIREVQGLLCIIETHKGDRRLGNGWEVMMPSDYGYFSGTSSPEGAQEQMDCYVGDNPESELAWIITQQHADTGKFDEYKVMIGFPSEEAARNTYLQAFNDGRGADRLREIKRIHVSRLKEWLADWQYGKHPLQQSETAHA